MAMLDRRWGGDSKGQGGDSKLAHSASNPSWKAEMWQNTQDRSQPILGSLDAGGEVTYP